MHGVDNKRASRIPESSPIYDIEHTYLFNIENITQLFAKAGFTDVEAFAVPSTYSARHWIKMLPAPHSIREKTMQLAQKIGFADIPVKLYAGNMAVIARKATSVHESTVTADTRFSSRVQENPGYVSGHA